jgi:hypothetical protein
MNNIDEVIFALPPGDPTDLKRYLDFCLEIGIPVRIVPGMFDPVSSKKQR